MKTTIHTAAVGAAVLTFALAGCASGSVTGADESDSATGADGDLTEVSYGLFPSTTEAVLQMGIDRGFFEDQGIDLELVVGQGSSAAQIPALNSGDLDFMLSSPVTPLVSSAQGLELKIVSGMIKNRPDVAADSTTIIVGPESDITRPKDFEGKTVSINAMGGPGEIGVKEAITQDGGDPDKVTFVTLAFPEVAAALENGDIDAGMSGSPFMQSVIESGGTVVSDFVHSTGLGETELVTIASAKLVESDPELVDAMRGALADTLAYVDANTEELRETMVDVMGTDPGIAEITEFPIYTAEIDVATIQTFSDLLAKYDVIDEAPDGASVVAE